VDDVLTTGATLEACALALLSAHGVKISIVTIGVAS
jgi:predicted amidophosphoribosyltransferase